MSTPPNPSEIRALSRRRDGPATLHLVLQLTFTALAAVACVRLAAEGHPARWIAVFASGVAVLCFFPLLHEAGHRTAFARPFANELGVWLGAVAMLQAPSFFREFHREHHRSTQLREADPEIANAPGLLDGFPSDPASYLFLVSGQFLMVGKLGFTLTCAVLPASIWSRLFPFIRPESQARVAWESRAVCLALGVVVLAGMRLVPGFPTLLLAWPVAHLLLGFYLMPEHTGLPNDGDQIHRTRTVTTNRLVRTLMWNMPYHAEHHAHPGVPYHALPRLHATLAPRLEHTARGYLAFHLDAGARALRLR